MIDEIELIFHRWIEDVWNKGREETIDELFDENGVAAYQFDQENQPIRGTGSYKKMVRFVRRAFTDIQVTIEQIASDGNKVVAVCTFAANRLHPENQNRPSAEPVRVSGLCQVIFENGKIIHLWNNLDVFGVAPES